MSLFKILPCTINDCCYFYTAIMCRQKYGDGVGGLMAFSRLLVF